MLTGVQIQKESPTTCPFTELDCNSIDMDLNHFKVLN